MASIEWFRRIRARGGWAARWWLTAVAGVVAGAAAPGWALPCRTPHVPATAVARAIDAFDAQDGTPSSWRRLGALLPSRVSVAGRQGLSENAGYYVGTTTGTQSERGLFSQQTGFDVRITWDLTPLWRADDRRWREGAMARALRRERLAERAGVHLRRLRRAQLAAANHEAGSGLCARAQADAEAATLGLLAVLGFPASGRGAVGLRTPRPPAGSPGVARAPPGPARRTAARSRRP